MSVEPTRSQNSTVDAAALAAPETAIEALLPQPKRAQCLLTLVYRRLRHFRSQPGQDTAGGVEHLMSASRRAAPVVAQALACVLLQNRHLLFEIPRAP